MRRNMLRALFLLPVLLVPAGCGFTGFKATTTQVNNVPHVPGAALDVATRNGAITITGDPGASDVQVTATISAGGLTQDEADQRLLATVLDVRRNAEGVLTVRVHWPEPKHSNDSAAFDIRLPDADGVTAVTSNGAVEVAKLGGQLRVNTSNGRVRVTDHDGAAEVDTSNGSVTVTRLNGPLTVDTSNGSVTAEHVAGPMKVDTSNGSVQVVVDESFTGRVVFDTSNGRVRVTDGPGRVVKSNLKRSGGVIVVGDESTESVIDTSNGGITFEIQRGS